MLEVAEYNGDSGAMHRPTAGDSKKRTLESAKRKIGLAVSFPDAHERPDSSSFTKLFDRRELRAQHPALVKSGTVVRQGVVDFGTDWYDAGRVHRSVTLVVMLLDIAKVYRFSYAGYLV